MKKVLSMILAIALMFSLMPTGLFTITASAETVEYHSTEYATYAISNGDATLVACDISAKGSFDVPVSVNWGKDVIAIGALAFRGCERITSIHICNVTSIDPSAFNGCTSLREFDAMYNNPVYSDREGVLYERETTLFRVPPAGFLNSYTVLDSVTSIGAYAFESCRVKTVTIPNGVTSIGIWAFSACSNLTDIIISDSVTSIGMGAFNCCDKLKDIWYQGTEADRQKIEIGSYNECLTNATWHYNTCTGEHTYVGDCDISCNRCGWIKSNSISHSFDDGCDAFCNVCDFVRDELEHIYDNDCDAVCGVCQFERTVGDHQYALNGELTCSSCKYSKAPETPAVLAVTTDSLTLVSKDGLEYSADGITWQDSPTFNNLTQNTQYTFYQRVKASDNAMVSESSPGLVIDFCTKTIRYDANGGQGAPDDQIAFAATTVTLSSSRPTREGFQFAGWATKESCGKQYAPGEQYLDERDVTFYALWQEDCATCNHSGRIAHECGKCRGYGYYTEVYYLACYTNGCPGGDGRTGYIFGDGSKEGFNCSTCHASRSDTFSTYYKKVFCSGYGCEDGKYYTTCDTCSGLGRILQAAPTVISYNHSSVTLLAKDGYEYSIDGRTWQTSPIFTGLEPNSVYTFYQRQAATETTPFGTTGAGKTVTTDRQNESAIPEPPTLNSRTATSITLNSVEGCEYSNDGINWQWSNTFSGLTCATEYTFYQRYAKTDTAYAGKSSAGATFKTDKGTQSRPSQPTLSSKNHRKVVLRSVYGCEYSKDGINWQSSPEFTELTPSTNYYFYIRKAETDFYYASDMSPALIVRTDDLPPYVPGDVDGDGEVSDWDGVMLARYLAGWTVEVEPLALDIDGDGEVTDWDGVLLDRYLAGWDITIG